MRNYFNYFTEIEERFQQRRGSLLMLSTLDWALIETWREAGIPLEAVLRGIDNAFDKHDAKAQRASGRTRKVNGLAWCAQSVMEAVEQAMEASITFFHCFLIIYVFFVKIRFAIMLIPSFPYFFYFFFKSF